MHIDRRELKLAARQFSLFAITSRSLSITSSQFLGQRREARSNQENYTSSFSQLVSHSITVFIIQFNKQFCDQSKKTGMKDYVLAVGRPCSRCSRNGGGEDKVPYLDIWIVLVLENISELKHLHLKSSFAHPEANPFSVQSWSYPRLSIWQIWKCYTHMVKSAPGCSFCLSPVCFVPRAVFVPNTKARYTHTLGFLLQ